MELVNEGIILSYKKVFKEHVELKDIIKNRVHLNHLILYSILSFHKDEESRIRNWSFKHIKEVIGREIDLEKYHILSRHQRLISLKYLLLNYKSKNKGLNFHKNLKLIYKVLIRVNDINIEKESFNHSLINAFLFNYKDNYVSQFKRSKDIFLEHEKMKKYNILFQEYYRVSLKEYIYVIFYLVRRYHSSPKLDYSNPYKLKYWCFDLRNDPIAKTKKDIFEKIFKIISFDLNEGKKFSKQTLDDYYAFELFENKPFLKISENVYIPIDGTFTEDLIFNNLFYKLLNLLEDEKRKNNFKADFGKAFETYISNLVEFSAINRGKFDYIYIPEFIFYYNGNKLKSPDAMLFDKKENVLLIIEIKSSRILTDVTTSNTRDYHIDKSYKKTKIKPNGQAYIAMERIIEIIKNKNNSIKDKRIYNEMKVIIEKNPKLMFLAISSNDITMSLIQHEIFHKSTKINISKAFFSMNIEAFETFIKIISSDFNYSFSQILGEFNTHKEAMSIKTYLAKLINFNKINNKAFDDMLIVSQNDYSKFFTEDIKNV